MSAAGPAAIPGRSTFFSTMTASDGHVSVVPGDMVSLMGSVLDRKLLDVTELGSVRTFVKEKSEGMEQTLRR